LQCEALSRPEKSYMNCFPDTSGSFHSGSSCEFSCELEFVLKGPGIILCGPMGQWNNETPSCEGTFFVSILFYDRSEWTAQVTFLHLYQLNTNFSEVLPPVLHLWNLMLSLRPRMALWTVFMPLQKNLSRSPLVLSTVRKALN
jgi:hypothetical protein